MTRHRMIADLSALRLLPPSPPVPAHRDPPAGPRGPGAGRWRPPDPSAPEDAESLAHLMLGSYRGSIDDAGETIEDARGEVRRLLRADFGTFDAANSVVFESAGVLAAATLLTRLAGAPFLAFSMTAPAWQRRGLARAGLTHVMRTLADAGERTLRLVVTDGNTPAESLYVSMGFIRETGPPPQLTH